MTLKKDLIVNLAPTGMIPDRSMTPHVPIAPREVIRDVLRCADLGVNIVHLHARDADSSHPSSDPSLFAEIIVGIRSERPDLVIGVSCSGRCLNTFDARSAVLRLDGDAKPDMASLTLSSLNFNKQASVNPPDMIQDLARCMLDRGIKPELEAFDLGMVNYARYLLRKGLIEPPPYFNLILGNIACAQADILHAGLMIRELPEDSIWSLGGVGDSQLKMNMLAVLEGGGVRVGLEDTIYLDGGRTELATNAALVERIVRIGGELGRAPMSAAACRARLEISR
jgi:uncharacterized protein (DUF849 family)